MKPVAEPEPPQPRAASGMGSARYLLPRMSVEDDSKVRARLRELWAESLPSGGEPNEADFFAAGGDSFALMTLLVAVAEEFDILIDFEEFVGMPSLTYLEARLSVTAPGA